MHSKTIFLLLILGLINLRLSASSNDQIKNETILNSQWQSTEKFLIVNPNQIPEAEKSVTIFISRLIGSDSQQSTFRSTSFRNGDLQRTIGQICNVIRKKVMEFAKACGLVSSVRHYEGSLTNFGNTEDWFSEVLLRASLLFYDLGRMVDEIWSSIDFYFQKGNSTPTGKEVSTVNHFGFLKMINTVSRFSEKFGDCLELMNKPRNRVSFDVNEIFYLMKDTPDKIVKTIRLDIQRASRDSGNNLQDFFCRFLINNTNQYRGCIKEMKNVEKCLNSQKDFNINNDTFSGLKPWIKNVRDFTDCQINFDEHGNIHINCDRKMIQNTRQQVKFIYEGILGRRISKRSPFHRVVGDIGNFLSKNEWSRQLTNEVYHYFAIYQEGVRKVAALSKAAGKDGRSAARYRKVSESLKLYKNGLLLKTLGLIGKVHRTTLEFEKFLVNGVKTALNESWQTHIRILTYMTEWMKRLLELYDCDDLNDNDIDFVLPDKPPEIKSEEELDIKNMSGSKTQLKPFTEIRIKNDVRRYVDESFDKLMKAMRHVNGVQKSNEQSTLSCLANNLLLVAMFMETVGFVSTLFCLGKHDKNEESSAEIKDEWGRKRRSLMPENVQELPVIWEENSSVMFEEIILNFHRENNSMGRDV